jgi:hypothetical protein
MIDVAILLIALSGPEDIEASLKTRLLSVRRIYVDRLTGGESAAQIRDLMISSLQGSKVVQVTENAERADAVLRGAAEDLIYTDRFESSESLNARGSLSSGASGSGSTRTGGRGAGVTVGQNESTSIHERKHEATVAVRLVDRNGDVIWATVQESAGGKFRGAAADAVERVTRQLVKDVQAARGRGRPD